MANPNVPPGAAILLDFIGGIEAPKGYGTIYGNNQGKLTKPLTSMTLDEVIAAGPSWTKAYKSSAAGRYQFMNATLKDLKKSLGLTGKEMFSADLQDRLGFELLKRRGYDNYMVGFLTRTAFGKALAQEWASLPVLASTPGQKRQVERGQSYYAGDGLNKALTSPESVEAVLIKARDAHIVPKPQKPSSQPIPPPAKPATPTAAVLIIILAIIAAFGAAFFFLAH
ncbi:hypothetical protein [Paradevosia shaoguanensis]|uniref:hypothetical protein n=1 Tax=Paradevosia shaoguanensis TaxID=1335043 RepID=UPI001934011D|nr:hypothetical protein [Paradevosia shaoguanensis]